MPDKPESRRIPYFGDFVLFDEIGRGGMGVVYNAQQTELDRPVALKVLHSSFGASGVVRQRLRIEAEAAARLEHPHIVPIFEIGEHEGHPYLAMQLIEGESLAERIARLGSDFHEGDAAALMAKIARAVHHAHQRGVLHRDLKPGNILLDDATGEPHLIDFGLAKCVEQDSGLTQTGSFLGTPAYSSPEQAAGHNKSITTASDIYSLGAILYTLLAGKPPFIGESTAETIEKVKSGVLLRPRSVRPALSANLETICLKCLEKEPARRYASALELAEDIERFLDGRPITARPVGVHERLWLWTRRNPVHAGLWIVASLMIVTSLAATILWLNVRSQARENESLLDLGSTISISRTRNPRKMSWSENIRRSLSPDRVVTQRPYYRDQVAATLEGLDAILIARRSAFLNEQVFVDHYGESLLLAGATNTETWLISSGTNRLSASEYPGKPIAHPDGSSLQVLRAPSGKLIAWQASQGRVLCTLELPAGLSLSAGEGDVLSAVSSDGSLLALALRSVKGNDVVFWRLPSGETGGTVAIDSDVTALAISVDGSVAACGNRAGQVRVWEVSNSKRVEQFSLSTLPVRSVTFASNIRQKSGQSADQFDGLLAAGDEGGSIGIWNLAEHRVQAVCRGSHYQVFSLAFNPDATILASGGRGPVRLWGAATGTPLLDLGGDYCGALSFSTDGFYLAASTDHHLALRQINVWKLQNGRGIATLRGLSSSATKVAFSPQSDRLAAIGIGWELGIWDLKHKKLLHVMETPRGFTADNFALAFNRDGRLLAISTGEEAQLWDVSTGRHLRSWKLPPGIADTISFPDDNSLFLLRMETLRGTEMPLSNSPWQKYPRVCRLRNLLASEPLKPAGEFSEFNVGVFDISASSDGRFFAIEGVGSINGTRTRSVRAVKSSTGELAWESKSTKQAGWGKTLFTSSGAQLVFTANGTDYRTVDLDAPSKSFTQFSWEPAAIGPKPRLWAARGDVTGAGRGVSLFDGDALRLNLGLDSELLHAPCFDQGGRWLAWGNADGTISLCNLPEVRAELGRAGLTW